MEKPLANVIWRTKQGHGAGEDLSRAIPTVGIGYIRWPAELGRSDGLGWVAAAVLASSPHDTQPWTFEVGPDHLEVLADLERNRGAFDPFRRELRTSLGCAVENVVQAVAALGQRANVTLLPDAARPNHLARIGWQSAPADPTLTDVIGQRRYWPQR